MSEKMPPEVTDHPEPGHQPMSAAQAEHNVRSRKEVAKEVRQSRDKAQYVREQHGHSLTLWLLFGGAVLWIPAIYYSFSPRHFWHA